MSKQRIVKLMKLPTMSFSLVAGMSFAQQQLPTQLVNNRSQEANMVADNVNTVAVEDIQTQPVTVTRSMAPTAAPQAETSYGLRLGQGGVTVSSAPATGVGGANTGNANTGGLQVQNVTVQASPEASASSTTAVNSEYARAEFLRQRRIRSEVDNETRLLERLEEGRLKDERARESNIETYYSSVGGGYASAGGNVEVITVPVAQTGAQAGARTIVEVEDQSNATFLGMNSFSITPYAGYRWFSNDSFYTRTENRITTGAALEGRFNRYLSLEANFTYGYDKFFNKYGGFNMGSRDTFEFSGGLKLGKTIDRVTPYVVGSLGGMYSKYNIDYSAEEAMMASIGRGRSTTGFLGGFGAGLDYSIARNFKIGSRFDYQYVISGSSSSSSGVPMENMDMWFGDEDSRFRLVGSLQLLF